MRISRRGFAKTLASLGASSLLLGVDFAQTAEVPKLDPVWHGVPLGSSTYSFYPFDIGRCISIYRDLGIQVAEIHIWQIEPWPNGALAPNPSPTGRAPITPEIREKLRQWRLSTPLHYFEGIGQRFRDAGIFVAAYNYLYQADCTDAEIDRTFDMARALGAQVITAGGARPEMLDRMDSSAKKHKMRIGIHTDGRTIRNETDIDSYLTGRSEYVRINLDIGHYSAAGSDPVALLKSRHEQIVDIHIKDRKKNGGPDVPFGEGDTPIREVLLMLRDEKWHIPANIEWEVVGDGDHVKSMRTCLDYCKAVLAS